MNPLLRRLLLIILGISIAFSFLSFFRQNRLKGDFIMLKNRIKKSIGILTMACFLATPISYVISANTTEAASPP
jgi:uncharacterized membrane protein